MITSYVRQDEHITAQECSDLESLPEGLIWLDLESPTETESLFVAKALKIDIPTREEIREIEASSRLYTDAGNLYVIAPVVIHSETKPTLGELACILTSQVLVTVHYTTPKAISTCAFRVVKSSEQTLTSMDALLMLFDAITDRLADVLESVGTHIDHAADQILRAKISRSRHWHRRQNQELQNVLYAIGASGELTNKVRTSLAGLDRVLAYIATVLGERFTKEQHITLKTLNRDLHSLVDHANFLASESNLLLDATVGLITIQQNTIITLFSVMAVIFMPPTLIASIYGMNFHHMPELSYIFAYPIVLTVMFLSAVIPLLYFRWRNWL